MILSDYFVQNNTMELSTMILTLLISIVNGGAIYLTYGRTYDGVFHSSGLRISLFLLPLLVAMLIMVVMTNLALSLGMLGALSIVRYRTPIKEPLDLFYVFWAISTGIGVGSGFFAITSISTVFIFTLLLVVHRYESTSPRAYGGGALNSGMRLLIVSFGTPESEKKNLKVDIKDDGDVVEVIRNGEGLEVKKNGAGLANEKNDNDEIDFGSIRGRIDEELASVVNEHVIKSSFFETGFCEFVCEVDVPPENQGAMLKKLKDLGGNPKLVGQN